MIKIISGNNSFAFSDFSEVDSDVNGIVTEALTQSKNSFTEIV